MKTTDWNIPDRRCKLGVSHAKLSVISLCFYTLWANFVKISELHTFIHLNTKNKSRRRRTKIQAHAHTNNAIFFFQTIQMLKFRTHSAHEASVGVSHVGCTRNTTSTQGTKTELPGTLNFTSHHPKHQTPGPPNSLLTQLNRARTTNRKRNAITTRINNGATAK